ncbi:MAG TPA: BREX system Lon protease-like protein BrxL, partial [Candidatus Ozemobacteraceae bacterium]|nr:BREX system Lon protease-like protein BrxL [Candidatus Ozemobacteraceae bacterium]
FYNTARRAVGLVGFWDIVAFDEVGRVRIKDPETIDILKSYMASGRFSRGVEIVANASLAFVGNIDNAIDQVVNSTQHDLFIPLPKEFDLAVLDRFFTFLPGWEMPKNSSPLLTDKYGFITDYLSEAFHALSKQSRYDYVNRHCRFGPSVEGRDEIAVKRTVSGLLKLLHPAGEPAPAELEQYVAYALEGRRRVKEQLNKRKHDDEYAHIRLSYIDQNGIEVEVWCPESKDAPATQNPVRRRLPGDVQTAPAPKNREGEKARPARPNGLVRPANGNGEPVEDHYTIRYGDTGYSYEAVFGRYLTGVREIRIEDPYIRALHQVQNLVRFCETALRAGALEKMHLVTGLDGDEDKNEPEERFGMLRDSLAVYGVAFTWEYRETMHDREVLLDNGWIIKIGRGLDYFMKPENWFMIGATDMDCRPCLETKVDIYRAPDGPTPPGDLSLPPRSV